LSENQYGFTPQKSTIDAIQSAVSFVKNGFKSKGFTLLVALDISGAFDNAYWPAILYALRRFKCPQNLYYLTESYFKDGKANLWFQNTEISKSLSKGCPQGSACGPGFWNLLIDSLLKLNLPSNAKIQSFADDTLLMIYSNSIEDLEFKANQTLQRIHQWSIQYKLEFNANKTTTVLFTNKIKFENPKIIFNNTELVLSSSMTYLGIEIDAKLRWKQHINNVKTKVLRLVMNLMRFARNKFGLNKNSLKTIYKGAIVPFIAYGCPVWINALNFKYNRQKLEGIQRLVNLRVCSAYRTVSSDALNVIANTMPIDLQLKQIAAEYYVKKQIKLKLMKNYINTNMDLGLIAKPINIFTLQHPSIRTRIQLKVDQAEGIHVFTTGHKKADMVGSGFCVSKFGKITKKSEFKLSINCSRFQSELFSNLMALNYFKTKQYREKITLFSNLTTIQAIMNYNSVTELIQEILENVHQLKSKGSIIWFTNNSLKTNREEYIIAKELAKDGSTAHRSIDYDVIPHNYVKRMISGKSTELWNERWEQTPNGSLTREFIPTIEYRKKVDPHFFTTFELTQVLTNHGKFNSYLKRFNIRDDEGCGKCGADKEDVKHIIFNNVLNTQLKDKN
jgi:hypothetical protein